MSTKDPFRINVAIRHPSFTPLRICKALSIKPLLSHAAGGKFLRDRRRRWSIVSAQLQEGNSASQFERGLRKTVSFIKKHSEFLNALIGSGGEVEIILNHTISLVEKEGHKNFHLFLAPAFVAQLAGHGIGLRIQGWQVKASPIKFIICQK